jgi:hypothetical protein
MIRPLSALAMTLALGALASAQITPIGPFTGAYSEGFQGHPSTIYLPCVAGRVFSNHGDLCTPNGSGCLITGSWQNQCTIFPHSGSLLCGSGTPGLFMEYTFDTPAQRFGGYFGNNNAANDGTAIFFDANGNQLASLTISAPANCSWTWNGWDAGSGPPIKRVQVFGQGPGGAYMQMDDMELDSGSLSPGVDVCQPGQAGVIACPCSNPPSGAPRGCDNSSGTGGAQLASAGSASLSADTVVFITNGERPTATSVLLQGNAFSAGGLTFGMGVRCAGGGLKRLYVRNASGGSISVPQPGDPSVSARSAALGDPIAPGTQRWYGVYYRDPNVLGGCPGLSTYNITQTQQVAWGT